jgi:hypothetical protein
MAILLTKFALFPLTILLIFSPRTNKIPLVSAATTTINHYSSRHISNKYHNNSQQLRVQIRSDTLSLWCESVTPTMTAIMPDTAKQSEAHIKVNNIIMDNHS